MNELIPVSQISDDPDVEARIRRFLALFPLCGYSTVLVAEKMKCHPQTLTDYKAKYKVVKRVCENMIALDKDKREFKADNVIDHSLASIDENLALRAAMFIKKKDHIQRIKVESRNLNLNVNANIPVHDREAAEKALFNATENFKENDNN